MTRYLVRRILFGILVLFIVSLFTFVVFLKLPAGDPARRLAGRVVTPGKLAEIRHNVGLDQPLLVQYGRFAKGLIPLPGMFLDEDIYYNWGNSVPVKEEIYSRLPVTITLAVGAAILWLLMGIPIGIASAIKPGSFVDRAGTVFAIAGVSAPIFWLGYVFLYVFAYGHPLELAPPSGIPANESLWLAVIQGRFILPWIVLALSFAAFYTRMVRGNLRETMSEDYIRTARAKGLPERTVIRRHGLRGALTPVVTMFGLDLAILLGGAVITETVFNLPGIGQYFIQSVSSSNYPGVMGVTVIGAFFVVVASIAVDVTYAFLDPRVRYT